VDSFTSNSKTGAGFVWRYSAALVAGLVALVLIQTKATRALEGSWVKGESNFFSSLARVQNAAAKPARVALVGSSITGRLPDRGSGFPGIVNVGIDGGSAIDGLRAINEGIVQVTDEVIIEINTLTVGLYAEGVKVSGSLRSPWFRAGLQYPPLSYRSRPTGMFYSWARSREGAWESGQGNILRDGFSLPKLGTSGPQLGAVEEARVAQISDLLSEARSKGLKVTLVQYPPAITEESVQYGMAMAISERSGVPIWNLGKEIQSGTVEFTDAVHLAPGSASKVLNTLIDVLDLPAG
jgi:hypothetical protein